MIGSRLGPYEIEPLCGREPFGDAQGRLRGSPQAKSRGKRGIPC
jgi:hypothetical protein